jgi:hypothetical protein
MQLPSIVSLHPDPWFALLGGRMQMPPPTLRMTEVFDQDMVSRQWRVALTVPPMLSGYWKVLVKVQVSLNVIHSAQDLYHLVQHHLIQRVLVARIESCSCLGELCQVQQTQ